MSDYPNTSTNMYKYHLNAPQSMNLREASALARAIQGRYVTIASSRCPAPLKPGWMWGAFSGGFYSYNGPHSPGGDIANNGERNGLYLMGRHNGLVSSQSGQDFGVSFKRGTTIANVLWDPAKIAFMGCQSQDQAEVPNLPMREPHAGLNGQFGLINQTDVNATTNANVSSCDGFSYDRNYLAGDGHVAYVHAASRCGVLMP